MNRFAFDTRSRGDALLYGGVALGVLAGAAVSTYVWQRRVRAALEKSPLDKADKMIESCERKLEHIEKMMRDLQSKAGSKTSDS